MKFRLSKMIGEVFWAKVPSLGKGHFQLKLMALDAGGIWVESQDYVNELLKGMKRQHLSVAPVLFLPFSSITYLVHLHEALALSEKSLGLKG